MLHSVELELEQVDCLPDEQQLLQRANVPPVLTGARPPFILLNELDFSPQAISSREGDADSQGNANKSGGYFHSDLGTCSSAQYSSSYYPTSSSPPSASLLLPSGEIKSLFRNTSWPDLTTASLVHSPRRNHGNEIYHQSQYQTQETYAASCRDENQSLPHLYEPHRNDSLEDYLPSLYEDDIPGKEPNGFAAKSTLAPKKNSHGWSSFYEYQEEAPVSPFKESLYSLSPTVLDGKIIVSDNDLKLFPSSDTSSGTATSRADQFNESCWESQEARSLVYFSTSSSPQKCYRSLETPRHRREKMFPQQTDSTYFVQQPPSNVSCSTTHQMIPFPAESVASFSNQNEPKRHNAFRKQSPLPDAYRISKTSQRISSKANTALFARQSPLTEMTKKYAQHPIGSLANSFLVGAKQSIPRLPGLQQQHPTDYSRAGSFEFGVSSIPQHWQTSNLNAPTAQSYYASSAEYCNTAGSVVPALHQPLRVMGTRKIGIYSPEARRERIQRFLEKRKERVFHKRIKYDCRKRLANACPRIKGRFVRKQDAIQSISSS